MTSNHYAAGRRVSVWARRRDLPLYFVLAFGLSWWPWPLVAMNPDSSPMVPFGPLLAAIIAAALTGGRRELRRLVTQLGRWPSTPYWYLIALLVPVLITGLAAGLTVALGGAPAGPPSRPDAGAVLATFVSTVVIVGLFEEVGWRGYALPRLQQKMTGLRAALLLGVIWGLWHLPLLVSDPSRQRPVTQFVILVVAQSVVLTWLYNSTRASLPLVIISHATIDTVARFVLPQFTGSDYQLIWWCQAALWTGLALLVAAATQSTLNAAQPHRTRIGSEATSARAAGQTRP
jgi:membrane protease YdiL (CAAX protease family)